ncbi:hypothetical protein CONCODRAFT_4861 [Conidiobolus coronatus NRRL 28638]|uniref:Uncharacterized protein n=1 Tax=Conidiobolus coronatus (strain ATCC 28846 / CBS 209.66 / NRRL 28638) TaxID=796925 RepID=A0A137PBJ5_CONC2|nr:hypothetical protein CONCODRAFT_4861 [Conidiobolus coronatus NRRL 28638]|eukprot:KXN72322.1 hypothetical protein CONCODRAFT_4861 [Conidiobolus coronatus NRRL 28638]
MNILAKLLASSALFGSALCTVSPVHLNFGCLKEFSGDVSYNDTQLTNSLLVRFRNNYHCYNWCDYFNIQISPNPEYAKAVLGKFDLSKPHDCTEWYNHTPVDENKEVSGWVAMDNELKFNNTHWSSQETRLYSLRLPRSSITKLFEKSVESRRFLSRQKGFNEVLLFNPEYKLTVNHQCLMSIQMLNNLQIQNDFSQERCLSLEKNDWKVTPQNGGWHDAKECTHDDVHKRLQLVDAQNSYYEDITFCKTIPFARGDNYISCTDGQKLQVIPNFDEDIAVKVFFAFAKTGTSAVPLIGNVLTSIIEYLEDPDSSSFKNIAKGVAADIGEPISELSTKSDIVNRIAQTLIELI